MLHLAAKGDHTWRHLAAKGDHTWRHLAAKGGCRWRHLADEVSPNGLNVSPIPRKAAKAKKEAAAKQAAGKPRSLLPEEVAGDRESEGTKCGFQVIFPNRRNPLLLKTVTQALPSQVTKLYCSYVERNPDLQGSLFAKRAKPHGRY